MIYRIKKFIFFLKFYLFIFLINFFFTNISKSVESWKNTLHFSDSSKIKFNNEYFYNGQNEDILSEIIGNLIISNAKTKDLEKNVEKLVKSLKSIGYDNSQENYWLYPIEFKPMFLDPVNFEKYLSNNCSKYSKEIKFKKNNNEQETIKQLKKIMEQCMPIVFKKLSKTTRKPFFRFLKFNKPINEKEMFKTFPEMKSKKNKFELNIHYSQKYFQRGKFYLLENENNKIIYKIINATNFYNVKFESIGYFFINNKKLNIFSMHCFKKCTQTQQNNFNQIINPIINVNNYKNIYKIKKEKDLENIAITAKGAYNLYRISRIFLLF